MIRDEAVAKNALSLLENADRLLMESIALVKERCPREESKQFLAGMSHVLGNLFFRVMEPIYREHPSLAPPDTSKDFLDSWNK